MPTIEVFCWVQLISLSSLLLASSHPTHARRAHVSDVHLSSRHVDGRGGGGGGGGGRDEKKKEDLSYCACVTRASKKKIFCSMVLLLVFFFFLLSPSLVFLFFFVRCTHARKKNPSCNDSELTHPATWEKDTRRFGSLSSSPPPLHGHPVSSWLPSGNVEVWKRFAFPSLLSSVAPPIKSDIFGFTKQIDAYFLWAQSLTHIKGWIEEWQNG